MENSIAADTQLYELFRETLGKDKAEHIVNHIRIIAKSEVGSRMDALATGKQLSNLEMRTDKRFNELELRVNDRFNEFELRMDRRFNESEARVNDRFNEFELRMDRRFNESEARMNDRFNESEARVNDRFNESEARMNDLEVRLIDRIHKAQVQTIIWIVTIGVLQFVASYLLRA